MMSHTPSDPPEGPEPPKAPPSPELPEAWRHSPDPNWKPSAPTAPPHEKSTSEKVLSFIGYTIAGIGILVVVAVLLFLGTCFLMLAKH